MRLVALVFAVALALPACHRGDVRPDETVMTVPPGKVLILPPRDMVQGGGFHAISPGTGSYLLGRVRPLLEQAGWRVLTTDARFSNVSIADVGPAIAEGRRQQADYVLRLVLGEFLDAAPMTFRPDYVILHSAELWSTKNAVLVWSLADPMISQGTNLRDYHRLIDELAELVVDGMVTARIDASLFTKPEVIHPNPSAASAPPDGARAVTERPAGERSVAERLQQLDRLGESGMITPEEYRSRREAILNDL